MLKEKCVGRQTRRNGAISVFIRLFVAVTFGFVISLLVGTKAEATTEINTSDIPANPANNKYELTDDTVITIDQDVDRSNVYISTEGHCLTIREDPTNPGCNLKVSRIAYVGSDDGNNILIQSGKLEIVSYIKCAGFTMQGGELNCPDGILASVGSVVVTGGIINSGDIQSEEQDILISGGIVNISIINVDPALFAERDITITGGEVTAICEMNNGHGIIAKSTVSIGSNAYVYAQGSNGAIKAYNRIMIDGVNVGRLGDDGRYYYPAVGVASVEIGTRKSNNTGNATLSSGGQTGQTPSHEHVYSWKTTTAPTADTDGEEVLCCDMCGAEKERRGLAASGIFESETIDKIMKTPAGGMVIIETNKWNTFGRGVRDALVARPDVTLKISFLSEGHKGIPLKITAPATKLAPLFDENGYLGLLRAGLAIGYDK